MGDNYVIVRQTKMLAVSFPLIAEIVLIPPS